MKITIEILNTESTGENTEPTWYSRYKSFESDLFDEDIVNCPNNHSLGRVVINDIQITSKSQISEMILFLENVKRSLKY